ncbi:MAG: glycosyltransferase [Candidatus Nanopelagicales bacterium]
MRPSLRSAVIIATVASAALSSHSLLNACRLRSTGRPGSGRAAHRATTERVSLLLPVRDEQRDVRDCVGALLRVEGVEQILVLDDGSTDLTAQLAADQLVGDSRARLMMSSQDDAPPAGWLGKPWACQRLADAATGTVLVFVDADVRLEPDAVTTAVSLLRDRGLGLISPYPRQAADGVLPRLVQPLLQWSWLTFVPLRVSEGSLRQSLAVANGQFLVVDADEYRRAGGHAAVRAEVIEDVAIARNLRGHGARTAVTDGSDLATCRMYQDDAELVEGYRKSLWAAFGSPAGALAATGLLAFVYLLPPIAAIFGRDRCTRRWGCAGYAAGICGRAVVSVRTQQRLLPDVLFQPASIAALCALTGWSLLGRRRGTLQWKGRAIG